MILLPNIGIRFALMHVCKYYFTLFGNLVVREWKERIYVHICYCLYQSYNLRVYVHMYVLYKGKFSKGFIFEKSSGWLVFDVMSVTESSKSVKGTMCGQTLLSQPG